MDDYKRLMKIVYGRHCSLKSDVRRFEQYMSGPKAADPSYADDRQLYLQYKARFEELDRLVDFAKEISFGLT